MSDIYSIRNKEGETKFFNEIEQEPTLFRELKSLFNYLWVKKVKAITRIAYCHQKWPATKDNVKTEMNEKYLEPSLVGMLT